jgi:flagellar basal-body rod protein FlgF
MQNGIYAGLSKQMALGAQMDTISNNIANMTTPGYRAQNLVFSQYLAKLQPNSKGEGSTDDQLAMVTAYGQYKNTNPGPLQQTGNPLDVAVQGPGYFGVQTASGVEYTKAGNFQINAGGQLVTGSGQAVASAGGGSITLPKDAREVSIARDGTISTDKGAVGQLMVVEFDNQQELQPTGNGLYQLGPNAVSTPVAARVSTVQQGMLEGSNVQPIT